MFKNKITYRYYEQHELLVIYNYFTRATLYYESISATLLHNIISGNEASNQGLLKKYNITNDDYNAFMDECHSLLSATSKLKINDNPTSSKYLDNEQAIASMIYEHGIMFGMHIDITPKCNFRCIHCYHPFDSYDNTELTYEEIKELFQLLDELGVFRITISGGEPFLRKDLFKILEVGKKYHFIFEIFTNGYLLSDDDIKRLSQMNVSKLSFSYYGGEAEYKHITKKDGYNHLMSIVESCINYDVDYELKLILMKCNYNHLPEFIKLTQDLGIRQAAELNITPRLDSTTDNLSEKLDFDDYIKLFTENKDFFKFLMNAPSIAATDKIQCSAGRYGLYCDYKGDIYPCVSYRQLLGDYTQLKDIWNGKQLKEIVNRKNLDFSSFKKYSYCDYCYEICPGLSVIEGKDELDCNNSGCTIAKAIEFLHNTKI